MLVNLHQQLLLRRNKVFKKSPPPDEAAKPVDRKGKLVSSELEKGLPILKTKQKLYFEDTITTGM